MAVTRLDTDFPGASFSDTVAVEGPGRWIYVSGQVGLAPNANRCSGDAAAQTALCFDRIAASLERQGATLADIIKLTVYLVDLADYAAFSAERARYFSGNYPASTGVQVAGLLLDAKVEIEAVAYVEGSQG